MGEWVRTVTDAQSCDVVYLQGIAMTGSCWVWGGGGRREGVGCPLPLPRPGF